MFQLWRVSKEGGSLEQLNIVPLRNWKEGEGRNHVFHFISNVMVRHNEDLTLQSKEIS
jgi:hypothetical protein